MGRRMTRRAFLRDAALGGAGVVILSNSRSARTYAANNKLNVALIGVGGRGKWFVQTMPKWENVVAMCDVNGKKATNAFKEYPNLPKYHDFRKMLDEMDKQIEAVVVAVPDHSHAIASVTAMKHGKHVYCEKPLTRSVYESRVMRETAKKYKVATQMGNQGTGSGGFRRAVELVWDGLLGDIKEVYTWHTGGGSGRRGPPKGTQKIPDYLKWDLWLGYAAYRGFHPRWMAWGGWREFGTSSLGSWGSHSVNLPFMALKAHTLWHADPKTKPRIKVSAQVSEIARLSFPKWAVIRYEIPARGDMKPVTFTWFNGRTSEWRKRIEDHVGRRMAFGPGEKYKWHDFTGGVIVGAKGVMNTSGYGAPYDLHPEGKFKHVEKKKPKSLPQSGGHEREWLRACRGERPALSNFDYSGPLTEFLMLGHVATQFDEEFEYDPLECKVVNNDKIDAALRGERRKGWEL